MSSHFATSTHRRASPAYCLKGKWAGVAPMINARPTSVNVFVKWYDEISTDKLNFTETIHVNRNVSNNGYSAWSGASPPRIGISIADLVDLDRYDVTINVDLFGWIMYNHTFPNVHVRFRQPWGTTLLEQTWTHNRRFLHTRLLA